MNANTIPVVTQCENRYWREPTTWPLGRRLDVYKHVRAAATNYTYAAIDIANCLPAVAVPNVAIQQVRQQAHDLLTYFLNGMKQLKDNVNVADSLLPEFLNMRDWVTAFELAIIPLNVNNQPPPLVLTMYPNCHIVELVLQAKFVTANPTPANLDELVKMISTLQISRLWQFRATSEAWNTGLPTVAFLRLGQSLVVGTTAPYWKALQAFWTNAKECRDARIPLANRADLEMCGAMAQEAFNHVVTNQGGLDIIKNALNEATRSQVQRNEWNYVTRAVFSRLRDIGGTLGQPTGQKGYTYDHSAETGRAFFACGKKMLRPLSRCWKCRFIFNYNVNDGSMDVEDPTTTVFTANGALNCAEDLAHCLCAPTNPAAQAFGPSNDVLPFPNENPLVPANPA